MTQASATQAAKKYESLKADFSPKASAQAPVDNDGSDQLDRIFKKIILWQTYAVAGLSVVLLFAIPLLHPVYQFWAVKPDQSEPRQMVPLLMPNMTNRAILSWATTGVTEIMTFGFGDLNHKLSQQRPRFTDEGWKSFRKAFQDQKFGDAIRDSHMVLTTAPIGAPVIVAQGVNEKQVYEWRVQVPVIMTASGVDNVAKPGQWIIEMTIIRVKPDQNPSGIGIDAMVMASKAPAGR